MNNNDLTIRGYDFLLTLVFVVSTVTGCGTGVSSQPTKACSVLTGTPWTPNVPGVSAANHDSSVTLNTTVLSSTGPIVGWAQPDAVASEVTVSIDMTQDLGPSGSLSLVAQVVNFPGALQGGAYAYLVSLNDGTNEYINLTRANSNNDCAQKGFYNSDGSINTNCSISWPSAYSNRSIWEQRQGFNSFANKTPSVNIFPTCNWSGGATGDPTGASNPECAFNTNFFPPSPTPARLTYGGKYTAKYMLMADSYDKITSSYTAGLNVSVIKKFGPNAAIAGAIDLNLIFVGNTNIQASRTAQGQQNLNSMVSLVSTWLSSSPVNIKLGNIQSIEWGCAAGGDAYANVGLSQLSNIFSSSGTLSPASNSGKSFNVFFVSNIKDDSAGADPNLTILGVDGAIGAPPYHGTTESGMVVSTFDMINKLNANCPLGTGICSIAQIDNGFYQFSETVIHEMSHGLNLNHPEERDGKTADMILDTPLCTTVDPKYDGFISTTSCRTTDTDVFPVNNKTCSQDCSSYGTYSASAGQFCPLASACPFNNVMWWTTKNFKEGTGASDGNSFSTDQGIVMRYHPVVQ